VQNASRVPAGTFADDFSGALIALRVPVGTFVTGAYLNKCSRRNTRERLPALGAPRETCALDEARDDAIAHMIFTVGVPAGTFGESFNASQGFAGSTECSCRNTCGLAHASFDKALPASVRRAHGREITLCRSVPAGTLELQQRLDCSSQLWPMMLCSTLIPVM
jgi:hypothetical protein